MSSIQVSSTIVIPRAKMALNVVLNQQVSIVKCKDGLECPDGSTCCKNSAGKYACCPHPQVGITSKMSAFALYFPFFNLHVALPSSGLNTEILQLDLDFLDFSS